MSSEPQRTKAKASAKSTAKASTSTTTKNDSGTRKQLVVVAQRKKLLRLVMPLPVLGGSVAAWSIFFSYQAGKDQLPKQLLPCPPISLFTFQQPQQPIYAAVMTFSAVLFLAMTLVLHSAMAPYVASEPKSRSTLKGIFWWGIVAFIGKLQFCRSASSWCLLCFRSSRFWLWFMASFVVWFDCLQVSQRMPLSPCKATFSKSFKAVLRWSTRA